MEATDFSNNPPSSKSNPGTHRPELRPPSEVPEEYLKPLINMPPGPSEADANQDESLSTKATKDTPDSPSSSQPHYEIRKPCSIPTELVCPLRSEDFEACNSHPVPLDNNVPPEHCPETPPPMKSPSSAKHILSPYAPVFIPRNFQNYRNVNPEAVGGGEIGEDADGYPQQALRKFLLDVNLNPAKFQYRVESLVSTLDHLTSPEDLPSIINLIFDESVQQPNFRYSGARLCTILCHKFEKKQEFEDLLFQRLSKEMSRHKEHILTNNGDYLRGFGFFLAELYALLQFPDKRKDTLRDFLLTIFPTFLDAPTDENIKCVCKMLKLVGIYLVDHDTEQGSIKETLESIVKKLEDISSSSSQDARNMVQSVINLKEANWGKALSPATPPSREALAQQYNSSTPYLDEPVYYGPDGVPFSPEEKLFLQNNLALEDCDDGDNFYDDDVLDDEMSAAYEEFLRETGQ